MSTILEYKENALDLKRDLRLAPGKYVIVPSTKTAGDEGKYYLSVYFATGNVVKKDGESVFVPEGEEEKKDGDGNVIMKNG